MTSDIEMLLNLECCIARSRNRCANILEMTSSSSFRRRCGLRPTQQDLTRIPVRLAQAMGATAH